MALLDIEHLNFRVDGKTLLAGLEMTVGEGEIHALLGANRTGKTMLACLLMDCAGHAPTAGRMRFRAVARAEPIVEVSHPLAKVTHEAAVGTVDQRLIVTGMLQ